MCLGKKLVGTRDIYIQYTYFNSYVYVDIYIGKNRSWHCTLHCTQCTLHCTQFVCLFLFCIFLAQGVLFTVDTSTVYK